MLFIFDLDGTLLDTVDDLAAAVNHALATVDLPPRTREEVGSFLGNGIRVLVTKSLASRVDADKAEQAFAAFKSYYLNHCLDFTRPYEGIMPLLQELHRQGHQAAIVSNKLDPAVKSLNARFFAPLITLAIGEGAPMPGRSAETVRRKPCPDALHAVMQTLHANAEDTLYIGDTEVDILTAQAAGVSCISVSWGFRSVAELQAAGATTLIHRPAELLSFLPR